MVINPFYTCNLTPALCAPHTATMTREQWVTDSTAVLDRLGPGAYLVQLMAVLTGDEPPVAGGVISPAEAIVAPPTLCEPHPPLIAGDQWLAANVNLINELGPRDYLARLLDVLAGNYP
jgi:hypothetical protein